MDLGRLIHTTKQKLCLTGTFDYILILLRILSLCLPACHPDPLIQISLSCKKKGVELLRDFTDNAAISEKAARCPEILKSTHLQWSHRLNDGPHTLFIFPSFLKGVTYYLRVQ